MDKKELRKIIKTESDSIPQDNLRNCRFIITFRFQPHLQNAQTILMYYSLPDEVDTHHYIDQLVSRGKR